VRQDLGGVAAAEKRREVIGGLLGKEIGWAVLSIEFFDILAGRVRTDVQGKNEDNG